MSKIALALASALICGIARGLRWWSRLYFWLESANGALFVRSTDESKLFASTEPATDVSVSGGSGPYTVSVGNPDLVTLGTLSASAAGATFVVSSSAIAVAIPVCVPPSPSVILAFPVPGSAHVSTSLGNVWLAALSSQDASALASIPTFAVRLVGSDGSSVQGANLYVTSTPPPSGSASSAGYTTYAESAVSTLSAGLSYTVQLTNSQDPCMPPVLLGSFYTI